MTSKQDKAVWPLGRDHPDCICGENPNINCDVHITKMPKQDKSIGFEDCEHEMEYGQEAGDFQRNAWQMRCAKCGYKSYMVSVPQLNQKEGSE